MKNKNHIFYKIKHNLKDRRLLIIQVFKKIHNNFNLDQIIAKIKFKLQNNK